MSALTSIVNNTKWDNKPRFVKSYSPYDIQVGRQQIIGHPYLLNSSYKPIEVLVQETRKSDTARLGQSLQLPDRRKDPEPIVEDVKEIEGEVFEDQEGGRYVPIQVGEGFLKSIKKGIKKAKKIGKTVKKVAGVVKKVAKVADKIGVPGASQVAKVAGTTQKVLKKVGMGADGTEYYQDGSGSFFKKLKKGIKKAGKIAGKVGKVAGIAGDVAEALGKEELAKKLKKGEKIGKAVGKIGGEGQTPQAVGRAGNIIAMKGSGLQETMNLLDTENRGVRGNEKMSFVPTHPLNYRKAILQ
jgi:hypothetical protein